MMRIVVTRPEPSASALALRLRELGHEPLVFPLLEFERLSFDEAVIEAADGLIITSSNALRALEAFAGPEIKSKPLYCVGSETARRALEAGFVAPAAVSENAEQLAAMTVSIAGPNEKLVHLSGADQAFDMAEALASRGFNLTSVIVYRMMARDCFDPEMARKIEREEVDGLILLSPRTAAVYVCLCTEHRLVKEAGIIRYFCLSDKIASKLSSIHAGIIHVPKSPELAALLQTIGVSQRNGTAGVNENTSAGD